MAEDLLDSVVTFLARGYFFPRASATVLASAPHTDSAPPEIPAAPLPTPAAIEAHRELMDRKLGTKTATRAGIGIDRTVEDPIARAKILHDIADNNRAQDANTRSTGNDIQTGAAIGGTAVGTAFGVPQAGAWVGKAVGFVSQPIADFVGGQSMGGLTVDEQISLGLSDGSKYLNDPNTSYKTGERGVKVGGRSGRLTGRFDQEEFTENP